MSICFGGTFCRLSIIPLILFCLIYFRFPDSPLPTINMVLVSSAILGAATGTGLALVVAVTIVVYRYYLVKRQGKEWAQLEEGRQRNRYYSREVYVQVFINKTGRFQNKLNRNTWNSIRCLQIEIQSPGACTVIYLFPLPIELEGRRRLHLLSNSTLATVTSTWTVTVASPRDDQNSRESVLCAKSRAFQRDLRNRRVHVQ